ncbi:MAG: response regulator [Candidatus Paceibacterota bacterium]|jgi:DNA-binding response OmpR family regulator|nr:response regulator [Candidatus Paceibacterota bacterium]MDD5621381.1 response regulator [Candidatus Paceibacterota bacterium]
MAKILFIEDELALQKSLGELLSSQKFEVVSAIDGETGVKMSLEENPDLILLDLILPKLHGLQVLERIKSDPRTNKIPVIILTNLEGAKDVEKALELGATTYLVKANYDLDELVQRINKAIIEG